MIKKLIALILAGYGLWGVALRLIDASKGNLDLTNFLLNFILFAVGGYWFYKQTRTSK